MRGASGGTFVQLPEPESVSAMMGESILLWFNSGTTSLAEVNAAREWIERRCVRSAARNRTDENIEAIREAMEAPGIGMDGCSPGTSTSTSTSAAQRTTRSSSSP